MQLNLHMQGGVKAMRCLRVQFVELLHTNMLNSHTEVRNNSAGEIVSYLREKYRQFLSLLLELLKQSSRCHMDILQAIMECARAGEPFNSCYSSHWLHVSVMPGTSFACNQTVTCREGR